MSYAGLDRAGRRGVVAGVVTAAVQTSVTPDLWARLGNIFANLLPLIGVLLFDWDVLVLMLTFWLESAVIGIYNAARLAVVGGVVAVLIVPFFLVHYGGFMAGHLFFLLVLFGRGDGASADGVSFSEAAGMLLQPWVIVTAVAFLVSHGLSFWRNFIGRHEYEGLDLKTTMQAPYSRIVVMHFAIILGGFAVSTLGTPKAALAILVMLKLAIDQWAHLRERRRFS